MATNRKSSVSDILRAASALLCRTSCMVRAVCNEPVLFCLVMCVERPDPPGERDRDSARTGCHVTMRSGVAVVPAETGVVCCVASTVVPRPCMMLN